MKRPRHAAPSLADRRRAGREPSPREQQQMVPQSLAYQNASRVWNLLPASSRQAGPHRPQPVPPLLYFQQSPDWASGITHPGAPGAGFMGGDYMGPVTTLGAPASAYAHLDRQRMLLNTLLHETAHTAQPGLWTVGTSNPTTSRTDLEGGADAWAILQQAAAAKMLGITPAPYVGYPWDWQFNPYGDTSKPGLAPHTLGNRLIQEKGRAWALRGQFQPTARDMLLAKIRGG